MARRLYILGTTALFALLGWWAGSRGSMPAAWIAALGACVGWALGAAFARFLPAK